MAFPLPHTVAPCGKYHREQFCYVVTDIKQSGMALVLVEGEEQLGNLTGQTAISGGSLAHKATSGHFVLALLLTALLTVFTNV